MSELTMFFLAQTLIIGMVVVAAHVATKVAIAKLQVQVESLKEGHDRRDKKIEGMSRSLSNLAGRVKGAEQV